MSNLIAEPHPRGGQIDLRWSNPPPLTFAGVKVFRRQSTFPDPTGLWHDSIAGVDTEIHDDPSQGPTGEFSDTDLTGEAVYYYAVVPYDAALQLSEPSFVSAMAASPYDSSASLYRNLPALYARYDTVTPPEGLTLDPADRDKGQLRRLIDMFGLQFDLLRSFAAGMRSFSDVGRIDGALLRLLADWIGWQTDFTLSIAQQRNEIAYAPHCYRTTGTAANLRAMINRLTTFDVQLKEFVHNVFLSSDPEQLTMWEAERRNGAWSVPRVVTLDVAHDGRPAVLAATDGLEWVLYHARQTLAPSQRAASDAGRRSEWHLSYKIRDQGDWQAARRLTFAGAINKYPAVLQRSTGNVWVFWSRYDAVANGYRPQLQLSLLAAGRSARAALLRGTQAGPWAFVDGDQFRITAPVDRRVTFHDEDLLNPAQASPDEVAGVLDRELPGVAVTTTPDATIVLTSLAFGAAAVLTVPASTVATRLGLVGSVSGVDAVAAELTGERAEPFALADGDTLNLTVDGRQAPAIAFQSSQTMAAAVMAGINAVVPGLARVDAGKLVLRSPTSDEESSVALSVNESSAASKLGFAAASPAATPLADDSEPAACEDGNGNVWLFWSSRRSGRWKIWYNRFDGTAWGAAQSLTTGADADREPAVLFDASGGGTLWVFWSRRNATAGSWNIFYRFTTTLSFPVPAWTEVELSPPTVQYDNAEPAPILLGPGKVELYFSSNRADGWHVWSKELTVTTQGSDVQVTTGQFTHRAPAAIPAGQAVKLSMRSNQSLTYRSMLYPASTTIDGRYSGSTTADTANPAKLSFRDTVEDAQRYTYDTLKGDSNRYARDTVGVFLTVNATGNVIPPNVPRIADIVRRFLPIQIRTVFAVDDS